MLRTLREKRLLLPCLMTALAMPVLLGLGAWQMARKEWKEEILQAVASRAQAPAISDTETRSLACGLSDVVGVLQSCDFRRVKVRGTFDHANERHIFAGVQKSKDGQMPGYWIFTPFVPSNGADQKPILVNRGFVPEPLKDAASRKEGQTLGDVEIVAHVRSREERRWSDAPNNTARNAYFVRDPRELGLDYTSPSPASPVANLLNAGWFYLEMVEGAPLGGYPSPLAGKVELPNRHLEYAITWFGLAATLMAIFVAYAASRLRSPGPV